MFPTLFQIGSAIVPERRIMYDFNAVPEIVSSGFPFGSKTKPTNVAGWVVITLDWNLAIKMSEPPAEVITVWLVSPEPKVAVSTEAAGYMDAARCVDRQGMTVVIAGAAVKPGPLQQSIGAVFRQEYVVLADTSEGDFVDLAGTEGQHEAVASKIGAAVGVQSDPK
ncbi:MAG: hypothetical protein V9H26_12720 [Verrucomicrobiota bacterium]